MAPTDFYIDALNFYYGAVKDTPYKWVDFEALAHAPVPQDQTTAVRHIAGRGSLVAAASQN